MYNMKLSESEWKKLILNYLKEHKEENCYLNKIARDLGTYAITLRPYLAELVGMGLVEEIKIAKIKLYKLKEVKEDAIESESNISENKSNST
ncbi:MAG: hypothetical protein ACTSVB_04050 [Candidatus Heimdallarchaeaceae archaeon]